MKQEGNKLIAEDNKILRCKIDNIVYGNEVYMGKTFYKNGEYIPDGIDTEAKDYEEIWGFEFEDVYITSDANSYESLVTDLLRAKYSLDAELALLANIRKDAEKYAQEEIDFQAWRNRCKQKAKELING